MMRIGKMAGWVSLALAACSGEPERTELAEEARAPQAALAPLDSAALDEREREVQPAPRPSAAPRPAPRRTPPPRDAVDEAPAVALEPAASDSAISDSTIPDSAVSDTVLTDTARSDSSVTEAPTPPTSPPEPDTTPAPSETGTNPEGAGVLPAGTEIHAALNDSLSSRRDRPGKVVTAKVMQHVRDGPGNILIRAGSIVQLTVSELAPAESKSAADGSLELRVDGIRVAGELRPINAEVREVPHELKGRGVTASEAGKVGAGAAAGAVAGRVLGGNTKGAVIGGAVGAAAGAAVATQTADRDVVVTPRTPIVLVLRAPLVAIDSR